MNPNNNEFIVEDELNESNFTSVSPIAGIDMKQIFKKIQNLEKMALKNANGSNNVDQTGIMQIGLQMGKEIGEMKNKMDGIMNGLDVLKSTNEGWKAEKDIKMEGIKKENANGIAEMLKAFGELKEESKKHQFCHPKLQNRYGRLLVIIMPIFFAALFLTGMQMMNNKFGKIEKEMDGIKEENSELKGKVYELENQIEEQMANLTKKIYNEIEWHKYDRNSYKLNEREHGEKMIIYNDGFVATHFGLLYNGWNSVRGVLPIPQLNLLNINKKKIAFYFEVQIIKNKPIGCINIGFCDKQFALEGNWMGNEENSIGIWNKEGILIDGIDNKFGNSYGDFKEGDVVGIGIIYQPNLLLQSFSTCNGKFLGKAELPTKFVNVQLFPAISLYYASNSVGVNFGKDKFKFKFEE